MPRKLTPKQEKFCREYILDLNATRAAERAGYKDGNIGRQLITKNNVSDRIAELQKESFERAEIDADGVLKILAHLVSYDPRNVIEWGPNSVRIKDSKKLSEMDAKLVTSITETPNQWGTRRQIKLPDRLRAIELLGKHYQLFTEQLEIKEPVKGSVRLMKIKKQVRRSDEKEAEEIN